MLVLRQVVSFLKKSIADIHQLSILTMKYEKVNEDDTKEIKETTAAEVIGMTKASMAALERCRLLNYLENDDEKRMKVLMPVCVKAYEVVEPYLTWTLDGDGKVSFHSAHSRCTGTCRRTSFPSSPCRH